MAPASLPSETLTKLDALLAKAAETLPGTFFVVTSPEAVLYSNQAGKHDVLKSAGADNTVQEDSVLWFASTTKLLTSIAVLQLVEKGLLTLDTPVDEWLPEMAKLKIISEFKDGEPIFVEPQAKITIRQMLNQTSGVGAEMSPRVQAWKKWTKVGGGYVNSCKVENLVNTPLTEEPGTRYQYGNSAEWLGLLIARLTGGPLEDYFQANIFGPLGLPPLSTFYPHSTEELRKKVMPIRFWDEEKQEYQALVDQVDLLKLPRETKDIEYPVAGGGIYTPPRSYALILQSLLSGSSPLLSRPSMDSLFESTLPTEQSRADLAEMVGPMSNMKWTPGDVDWSTGLCVWHRRKEDGEGKPWGRLEGSAGWAGAANTMYWVDRKAGIACVFSSNLLPFSFPPANEICAELERVLYEALGF